MKTIIGLAGVKTSGKSTTSDMIKKILGEENVHESALADKLKNSCAKAFGIQRIAFDDQRYKEIPFEVFGIEKTLGVYEIMSILEDFNIHMEAREIDSKFEACGMKMESPRHIAQIVGTEILRNLGDEDIHCKNMETGDSKYTIVSDLRFPNEFEYFMNNSEVNFIPIYIQRDEAEIQVTPFSHSSETSVFLFNDRCIQLDNNGSLQLTRKQLKQIIDTSNI